MNKLEYIIKQLSKTNKKNYENYVITRIWHLLNDLNYKFITQQYIVKEDNKYYFTDMFFPQLNLHIEVDEKHHKKNVEFDSIREMDIISVTNHKIKRVDITKSIEEINRNIDDIISEIKKEKEEMKEKFIPWNLEEEYKSETYIKKGYLNVEENVAFRKSVDAVNCFGRHLNGLQQGGFKHPIEEDIFIWFPKLFPNKDWINSISNDEETIYERNANKNKVEEHLNKVFSNERHRRIVFAKVKDTFGNIMYRFKGLYKLNEKESIKQKQLIWERESKVVKTYTNQVK